MNAVVGTILGLNVNGTLVSMGAFNWDYYWLSRFVSDLALEQSDDDVILTWVNNGTVDWDYILIDRKISGGDYAQIAQITKTLETYTDENFTVEGTYYYRIRLIKGTHYSSYCTAVSIVVNLYPIYVTSGSIWYRKDVRDEKYVIDYSSDGGTTWVLDLVSLELDEDSLIIDIDFGLDGYRELVREAIYVIDRKLTELGFDGVEDVDWENVVSIAG